MRFDILTIFPGMFDSYIKESLLKRAQKNGLVEIGVHNTRDYATDKHRTTDDTPYGGGPGMVMKVEPIAKAVNELMSLISYGIRPTVQTHKTVAKRNSTTHKLKPRVILFSAKGKQFDAKMATRLSKYDQLILICGRYEGVDERVAQYIADEEISIGPYVLTGGELAALVLVDAVARHVPGVLGKSESVEEKRHGVGTPVYTRPEIFQWTGHKLKVPKVLLSGDHKKIEEWRKKKGIF
jgi:tRNA (guanine37-N1)-methyltransferase